MSKEKGEMIETPHEHDVLSGRGNFVNYHVGNEYFRALVRKHKVAYVACPKQQKSKFSQLIVDEIKSRDPPGRFLKQDANSKMWIDIGEKKALDKTRQALREGAPDIQKELGGDAPQATSKKNHNNDSSRNQSEPFSVGSTLSSSYQPQTPSGMPQIHQMTQMSETPISMNNFAAMNQFDSAALYSGGLQQQQQQQQQFCDNNNNSNGGMNSNHLPQHTMLNINNNSMMMMNFQQQQQQQQQQDPMSMLKAQHQQAMMTLLLQQKAQQQQQQQHGQLVSAPTLTGPSGLQGNQNMLSSNLVASAPLPPKTSLSSYLESRPIGSNNVRSSCVQEQEPKKPEKELLYEDEYIAPLRPSPQKRVSKLRKDDLEASSSSLMVDNIFSNADKNRSTTKFNNSGLSIMSLSVNNIDNESDIDPDHLGRLFDSSLKLNHQSSVTSLQVKAPKSPYKRSFSHDESITQEKGMASAMEMSLNTISSMSEFGDSYAIMNDEMSFANVFADGGGSEYR